MERSLKAWRHEQGRQRGVGSCFFAEWSESGIRTKENHRKKYRGARGCRCTGQKTPRRRLRLGRSSRLQNAADSHAHQHRHRQALELVTQALPAPTLGKNRLHRVLGRVCCSQTHVSALVENSTFTKATANPSSSQHTASFSHLQETHTAPQETHIFPQRGPMICADRLVEPTDGAQRCMRVCVDKRPHQKDIV